MARFEKPVKCPKCGKPCWSTKQLNKFHDCKSLKKDATSSAERAGGQTL